MIPALNPASLRIRRKIRWWVLVVLWCGLIFYMSNQPADESSRFSLFLVDTLNRALQQLFGPHAVTVSEDVVRKCAHFLEYLVLGGLLFMGFLDRSRPVRVILRVFIAGFLFAVSDELHQLFVPGRTLRVLDLGIDALGIAAGCLPLFFQAVRQGRNGCCPHPEQETPAARVEKNER